MLDAALHERSFYYNSQKLHIRFLLGKNIYLEFKCNPPFYKKEQARIQHQNGSKGILLSILAVVPCCLGKREKFQIIVAKKISLGFLHQDSDL